MNRSPGRAATATANDGSWQLTNFFEALSPRNAGATDANKSMLTHEASSAQQQYAKGGLHIASAVTKKPTPNRETIMASFTSKLFTYICYMHEYVCYWYMIACCCSM
jgi:hypothetical protein